MNAELEALLKVFDAFMQARGGEAERFEVLYDTTRAWNKRWPGIRD